MPRTALLTIFLCIFSILSGALVLEHIYGLEPCPLCILQRITFLLVGLICLISCCHNPRGYGQKIYYLLASCTSFFGMYLAGKQIWLQHLPKDEIPACTPPVSYMLDNFPLQDVISFMFHGTGECAKVQWQLLGLSIPSWSFIAFTLLSIVFLYFLFFRKTPRYIFH